MVSIRVVAWEWNVKVTVIGTGYVGLVTGAGLAETGNHVTCVDVDVVKVGLLRQGKIPIHEPGLETMVQRNAEARRLVFTTELESAVADAEVIFIAVGTPPLSDGSADLTMVDAAADAVARCVGRETVLALKSTVPVGTHARVCHLVKEARHRVHVVSNPEFLREGSAVSDFMHPDRIIVGCDDEALPREMMGRLYHPVSLSGDRVIWMNPQSAELTKYVANTMLAMRVAFMNEVAALCEPLGADVHQIRQGVGSDERIGPKFLHAGPGYGGSCFPKDVRALVEIGRDAGVDLELASATHRANNKAKGVLGRKIRRRFGADLRGKSIAVWGLSFKPRTDDVRESPALTLLDTLLAEGAVVRAHDPVAVSNARRIYEDRVEFFDNAYEACEGASALVLVTEWREYQNPDFEQLRERMAETLIFDGRNIWSTYGLPKLGFEYHGIGTRS